MKLPLIALLFATGLIAVGSQSTLAQAPTRADELRRTLDPARPASSTPPANRVPASEPGPTLTLEDGTVVKLKLMRELFSPKVRDEEAIDFEVIEDVLVDGIVVISRGARAVGTVIDAQAARRMGRTGRIGVRLDWVFLATGKRATLRAVDARSDGSRAMGVAENVMLAGTFFFPAAPLFLLQKGKEVTIPKGTLVTAFIDGEVRLDRQAFEVKP